MPGIGSLVVSIGLILSPYTIECSDKKVSLELVSDEATGGAATWLASAQESPGWHMHFV